MSIVAHGRASRRNSCVAGHPSISTFSPTKGSHARVVFLACIWWVTSVSSVKKEVLLTQQSSSSSSKVDDRAMGATVAAIVEQLESQATGGIEQLACIDSCSRGRTADCGGGVPKESPWIDKPWKHRCGNHIALTGARARVDKSASWAANTDDSQATLTPSEEESSSWQWHKQRPREEALVCVSWAVTAVTVAIATCTTSCCQGLKNLSVEAHTRVLGGRVNDLGFLALGNSGSPLMRLLICCQTLSSAKEHKSCQVLALEELPLPCHCFYPRKHNS